MNTLITKDCESKFMKYIYSACSLLLILFLFFLFLLFFILLSTYTPAFADEVGKDVDINKELINSDAPKNSETADNKRNIEDGEKDGKNVSAINNKTDAEIAKNLNDSNNINNLDKNKTPENVSLNIHQTVNKNINDDKKDDKKSDMSGNALETAANTAAPSFINKKNNLDNTPALQTQDNLKTSSSDKSNDAKEKKEAIEAKEIKEITEITEKSFMDNEQIKIVLSNRDINRILVKGDKIQSINGPTGLYTAKNDFWGSVYISLYGENRFTVFVSTVKGHSFSLLVTPRAIPGKTVILDPTSFLIDHPEAIDGYQQMLINLITSMINAELPEDYLYSEAKKYKGSNKVKKIRKINFYNLAEIRPIAFYSGSSLLGVVSEIKNKTNNPIILKPSYFYHFYYSYNLHHGHQPRVRAAALSHQVIAPGGVGLLYQVLSNN